MLLFNVGFCVRLPVLGFLAKRELIAPPLKAGLGAGWAGSPN